MTPRERFLATMRFEPVDRPFLKEGGPWGSTLRRWRCEGLGPQEYPPQLAQCDPIIPCGANLWMSPPYEQQILAEDEHYITQRNDRGIVERLPKDPDAVTMPEHVGNAMASAADWPDVKKRLDPSDAARFPDDWDDRCAAWRRDQPVVLFQGRRSPTLFGFVRELMGAERTLLAFYDEPDLVHDMMETATELAIAMLTKATATAPVTTLFFWEDMCYRNGPLISPAMFREFMTPRYKRITDCARSCGIDVIFVDSDGDVTELIPLWLEAGLNGVYPMEVAAGMDVVALRKRFGKSLLMTGGIDKRVLAQGRAEIDRELQAKIPLAHDGGYIPHIDHSIPHDVPYENFVYYWQRKRVLLGLD